jgi:hypothetical protein
MVAVWNKVQKKICVARPENSFQNTSYETHLIVVSKAAEDMYVSQHPGGIHENRDALEFRQWATNKADRMTTLKSGTMTTR